VEHYNLPPALQKHQGVRQVPIGDVVLSLNDTTVAAETCEELFTPQAPHINMYAPFETSIPYSGLHNAGIKRF
jgi:NAD+ synthase (glutamine-hydrolysing)